MRRICWAVLAAASMTAGLAAAQEPKASNKPVLHGNHWVAITGKPLGATAGCRCDAAAQPLTIGAAGG